MRLSSEERLVLLLSQPAPSAAVIGQARSLLSEPACPVNYARLIELANLNRVTPLLYRNFSQLQGVPGDVMERLKKHYIVTVQRNAAHLEETLHIVGILQGAGVSSIPLKGSFAAETLLGDMGLYPTSDIDLLVHQDDLGKAKESLVEAGYGLSSSISEQDQFSGSYHLYFHRDATVLELHWNLVRRYFDALSSYWWEDAGEMNFRDMTMPVLLPEKYLLYLIFRFFSKGFMPLHHMVLMPALLGRKFDWGMFMQLAGQLKMRRLVVFTLKLMHDLFGINIPEELIMKKMIGYELLKKLVITGLFNQDVKPHLRMALFLLLLDSPADVFRVLIRRLFPSPAEIRLRYNIPSGSPKLLPYYLLNPLIMLFRKTKR